MQLMAIQPDWRSAVQSGDPEIIKGEALLKHSEKGELQPTILQVETLLDDAVGVLKLIGPQLGYALGHQGVAAEALEAGKVCRAVMTLCITVYKSLPDAENTKARSAMVRGCKSRLGKQQMMSAIVEEAPELMSELRA